MPKRKPKSVCGTIACFFKGILRGLFRHPAILIAIIAAVLIGSFAGTYIERSRSVSSNTTQFGLQNIGELATQSGYYTNVQVISDAQELFGWQIPLTESKYVFSYDGVLKAGIDFEQIQISMQLNGDLRVEMPEVRILSNEIDLDSLVVYDSSSSIFTPLDVEDMNLSLIEMREEAQANAIANGLLTEAQANAETLLTGFLMGAYENLDPESIDFVWPEASGRQTVTT